MVKCRWAEGIHRNQNVITVLWFIQANIYNFWLKCIMKLGHEPTLNLGLHVALFHAICCYACMRESRGGGSGGGECLPPPCNIQVSLNYIIKLPKNMPGPPPLPPANSNNHRTPPFPPRGKYNCVRKLNWIEKTNQLKKVTVNCWTISKIINLRHYIYTSCKHLKCRISP